MPRQPHRERSGVGWGGWVPILLPPPEWEVLFLWEMEVGTGLSTYCVKRGRELLPLQRNGRYEGQGGSQVVCVPGQGRIYVQTAAFMGARLAVSQTRS